MQQRLSAVESFIIDARHLSPPPAPSCPLLICSHSCNVSGPYIFSFVCQIVVVMVHTLTLGKSFLLKYMYASPTNTQAGVHHFFLSRFLLILLHVTYSSPVFLEREAGEGGGGDE